MQFIRKSTSALVQKAKPAVVEILVYDRQNRLLKAGTGFFISADGKLLTNYHVIAGGRSVVAKPTTGDLYQLKDVVAASERADAQSLLSWTRTAQGQPESSDPIVERVLQHLV